MRRCSACKFTRYCSTTCQMMAWREHKIECNCIVTDNDFSYDALKGGAGMFYGPLSGYEFQLIRHMATSSDVVHLYDNKDLSQPHLLYN